MKNAVVSSVELFEARTGLKNPGEVREAKTELPYSGVVVKSTTTRFFFRLRRLMTSPCFLILLLSSSFWAENKLHKQSQLIKEDLRIDSTVPVHRLLFS